MSSWLRVRLVLVLDRMVAAVAMVCLHRSGDERITPIGRRLRSYHLDEIPQLINVARGEMLLFGPRPETPEVVDDNDLRWKLLLQVPPGIAGPTQLVVGEWEERLIADDPDGATYR